MSGESMQNEKFAVTQVRLSPEVFDGLHKLRENGYNMAQFMRLAIGRAVKAKLRELEVEKNE